MFYVMLDYDTTVDAYTTREEAARRVQRLFAEEPTVLGPVVGNVVDDEGNEVFDFDTVAIVPRFV